MQFRDCRGHIWGTWACLMKEPECVPEAREGAEGHGGGLGQSGSCDGSTEEAWGGSPPPAFLRLWQGVGDVWEEDEEGW